MEIIVVIGGPSEAGAIRHWLVHCYPDWQEQEWLFVGVDGGSVKLLQEHLPMHLAIGDFDSITMAEKLQVSAVADQLIELPSQKDNTDFEEALLWIQEFHPHTTVHVFGAFGGRVDHAISCLWTVFRPNLQPLIPYLILEDLYNHVSFVLPGKHTLVKREQACYLSFITMTAVKGLTLRHVQYPLEKADYAYPVALISNEFLQESMEFEFTEGLILVGQTRDAWRQ